MSAADAVVATDIRPSGGGESPQPESQQPSQSPDSEEAAALARAIEGSPFSAWKEALASELESEANALKTRVHALQNDFDEASMFIRGDLAWRKQLASFHDKVNDALHLQMETLVGRLQLNADALSTSITESFARKDEQTKQAVEWQVRMYEDKLRRTRTSLKKEIDRFTHLEKCLRKEQAFQAKEMYDDLVLQLTTEHAAKEAALHALLRELRSSYNSMETGNAQLMESLRAARAEVDRLKKMLIQQTSNVSSNSPQRSSSRSPSRFPTSGGAMNVPSVADVYVQSLKQSLSTATQTIDGLKKQVAELTSEKEAVARKVRHAEDATSKANDELAKVTQLLSESHTALVASKKAIEQVENEKSQWKERFVELQFRTESNEQEVKAAKRLTDATKEYVASLEQQAASLSRAKVQMQKTQEAFAAWRAQDPASRDARILENLLAALVDSSNEEERSGGGKTDEDEVGDERRELELKLRYEFEKRYSEQLNLRVSHERKRVLARIETLCAKQQQEFDAAEAAATRSGRPFKQRGANNSINTRFGRVSYRVVYKIVSDAFEDLGFSEWSATDLDALYSQLASLQSQLAQHKLDFSKLEKFAETQGMVLAKADLLQQEKEFLLAELTGKYRELCAAHNAAQQYPPGGHTEPALELARLNELPLTVYGHPQRLGIKKLRNRPVSASPCLVASSAEETDAEREREGAASQQEDQHRVGCPPKQKASRVRPASSAGPNRPGRHRVPHSPNPKPFLQTSNATEPQQQVEHIRSILKSELLELSPPENQLEDGSHLGPDGVRFGAGS